MSPTTQVQPPPQDPSGANGGPGDAVEEFLRTVRAPARPDGPDPRVPIAFATGWHVADAITASGETGSQDDERKAAGALAASMLHADLARLREPLVHAEQNIAELAEAIDGLEDPSEHPEAAREVDRRFGAALMAADFRHPPRARGPRPRRASRALRVVPRDRADVRQALQRPRVRA